MVSVLFGNFLGTAIFLLTIWTNRLNRSTTSLAKGIYSAIDGGSQPDFLAVVHRQAKPALWLEALNLLKVGQTYSLFIEAFKLGS